MLLQLNEVLRQKRCPNYVEEDAGATAGIFGETEPSSSFAENHYNMQQSAVSEVNDSADNYSSAGGGVPLALQQQAQDLTHFYAAEDCNTGDAVNFHNTGDSATYFYDNQYVAEHVEPQYGAAHAYSAWATTISADDGGQQLVWPPAGAEAQIWQAGGVAAQVVVHEPNVDSNLMPIRPGLGWYDYKWRSAQNAVL
ncbi:hypothetical protein GOP47_0012602 [Adiantum capillus-veneris]|uniref:Uncharacterized protein n=1 Tax=Adiantum capillus-veneris TaxID=13818 RepID=A0A9D4URM4_ADICA|nr:hypothetical protein GOP47_0012601 [Adiantum capillus-veneris]KAI5072496.1 hypothetical protein GOP47_0012602 [Adiantum capillus-veneris]